MLCYVTIFICYFINIHSMFHIKLGRTKHVLIKKSGLKKKINTKNKIAWHTTMYIASSIRIRSAVTVQMS